MKKASAFMAVALLGLTAGAANAETVGYTSVAVPAQTDVYVSVPFTQDVAAAYTVTAVAADGVTVADTLTANQFQNLYFVRFTSGAAKGRWATVTSNDAHKLFIASTASVAAGDTFDVFKHQTLESVFPDALEGVSFVKSASAFVHSTEILLPGTTVGVNKSASNTYYFYNSAWRRAGSLATLNFDNVVIVPQTYFIERNNSNNALTFVATGEIATGKQVAAIPTNTTANDVATATGMPAARTLKQLNLGGTSAFVTSLSAFVHKDELLVFNNAVTGKNKSAAATYYYYKGAWRKAGFPATTSFNNEVLPAGSALLIRKAASVAGSVNWVENSPF